MKGLNFKKNLEVNQENNWFGFEEAYILDMFVSAEHSVTCQELGDKKTRYQYALIINGDGQVFEENYDEFMELLSYGYYKLVGENEK